MLFAEHNEEDEVATGAARDGGDCDVKVRTGPERRTDSDADTGGEPPTTARFYAQRPYLNGDAITFVTRYGTPRRPVSPNATLC